MNYLIAIHMAKGHNNKVPIIIVIVFKNLVCEHDIISVIFLGLNCPIQCCPLIPVSCSVLYKGKCPCKPLCPFAM